MVTQEDLEHLETLINLMNSSPVFTQKELKNLWDKDRERQTAIIERMLETGETYGQASGAPDFLNKSEEDFRAFLKNTDNVISQHTEIVYNAFIVFLKNGEIPAPYYAWRIAIILSKAKRKDKEKEFLTAWCRHFNWLNKNHGARYGALIERAKKLGIEAP